VATDLPALPNPKMPTLMMLTPFVFRFSARTGKARTVFQLMCKL